MGRRRRTSTPPARRATASTASATATAASAAGSSTSSTGQVDLAAGLRQVQDLYAQLPVLECRGLCAHSCAAHVDASAAERAHLLAQHGLDLDAPTPDGACLALARTWGAPRCSVHPDRPMICRLWGTAAAMPCPHGCTPTGRHLEDAATLAVLSASLDAGGYPHSGLGDLLHQVMNDPVAAGLIAHYLRGDRAVVPALTRHLHATGIAPPHPAAASGPASARPG